MRNMMNIMQRQSDRKDEKEHEQNIDNILTFPINRNVLTTATKHIKKGFCTMRPTENVFCVCVQFLKQ